MPRGIQYRPSPASPAKGPKVLWNETIVRKIFGKQLTMTLSSVIESSNNIIVPITCYLESYRKLISQPDTGTQRPGKDESCSVFGRAKSHLAMSTITMETVCHVVWGAF